MKLTTLGATFVCVAAFTLASSARANWRDDMWKRPVRIRDGVTLRAYAHEKPRLMKVYVAKIDLVTPGIGFTTTERASDWGKRIVGTTNPVYHVETKRETTADFMLRRRAEGRNVEIAFNTTPWRPWPMPKGCESCDLLGWCVADGVELSSHTNPTERKEALFVIGRDGRCAITSAIPRDEERNVLFAFNGFDILMTNGVDVVTVNRDEKEAPRPRMALGLADGGRTLVVVADDGRQPKYSLGATFADMRTLLRREGASDAVSMDGGGSVSLVVFDREKGVPVMLNRHPSKKVRANAISLGVIFGK